MIRSNNQAIADILKFIDEGKIQLPDFQRGWVWEDLRIRSLIASISNGYPIGAAMFLETGNATVHFKSRLFEGVDESRAAVTPERLVLDGQQRNTSIYRSMYSKLPVKTTDSKKKPIERFYYINIPKCLNTLTDRLDAIISVPVSRKLTSNFGKVVDLDLSTRELEFENHYFPLNIIFDSQEMMRWQRQYTRFHNNEETDTQWDNFYDTVIAPMTQYQIPVIELGNDVPKEAVCQVFENVNQGGVSLTVFELVTATFAADNFELRKDWATIWSKIRNNKLISYKNIHSFRGTDFLTAITLLSGYLKYTEDGDKAVSCKKKDVLKLEFTDYATHRDRLLQGLRDAVNFLQEECIFTSIDLPYSSQLIPLSVVFALDRNLWFDSANRKKLRQWFWCGVFGELYGSANETRYVNDVVGLMEWASDDTQLPDTVERSNFHATRLQRLYTRNSAAYKGTMALILQAGAKDFIKGGRMDFATFTQEATDIHHIFPAKYCMQQGIDRARWNSVINKTPIYARTNRIIGCEAPSRYISKIERNYKASPEELDERLVSHQIDVEAIRSDNFDAYYTRRVSALLDLIEAATGKTVSGRGETAEPATEAEIEEMNLTEE